MTTVYSRPGCQPCRMSKRVLEQKQIPHRVIDVDTEPGAMAEVLALGYSALPVIVAADGTHFSGFQPDRLATLPR